MANNASDSTDDKFALNQANAKWPDLYALLQVAPGADIDTLRTRIRESYTEATNNTDHRNIERRIHYQTMSERIIPQARRILLDPNVRARYDRELALQQAGDPKAQDYTTFLSNIYSAPEEEEDNGETIPGKFSELAGDLSVAMPDTGPLETTPVTPAATRARERPGVRSPAPTAPPTAAAGTTAPPDAAPIEGGFAGVAEAVAVSSPQPPIVAEAFAGAVEPSIAEEAAKLPSIEEPTARAMPVTEAEKPGDGTEAAEGASDALFASVIRPEGPDISEHSSVKLSHEDVTSEFRAKRNKDRQGRVSLGEDDLSRRAAGSHATRGKRLLSQTSQMLATGICAALLTMYILRPGQEAAGARSVPLKIAYASDMQGFMEAAEKGFESSAHGAAVDVNPLPMDSRAAMTLALTGSSSVDLWIPAESIWSDRYNEVADGRKAKPITLARSIALSPCILVARADHAAALHKAFPSGIITSWEALHGVLSASAAGHLGLTDPTASGAGAIARYYMASEWSKRHNVPWNKNSVDNVTLWQWMAGFEKNVAGSAKMTGDMVKDLALGTADRYWWAIAYESDAISWMNKGKKLDIFYLPQTNYADHPLCYIDRQGLSPGTTQARAAFEQFLRSAPMQKVLLQNGLRPTEIELTTPVENNPFTNASYKARGLKTSGFQANERINYRVLNALNAAWNKRYGQ